LGTEKEMAWRIEIRKVRKTCTNKKINERPSKTDRHKETNKSDVKTENERRRNSQEVEGSREECK
jgi:hypothetical protein